MNLLETIRALDAPYVVWLTDAATFDLISDMSGAQYRQYRYGQAYWCSGTWFRRMTLVPDDYEIDALLAGVGT